MLQQYFLLIFRNFLKNKTSFLINIVGLSSGLTCAILIFLWVNSELQMDNYHQQEVYQVMQNEKLKDVINTVEGTPGPLAEALAMEFPEVKHAVTTSPGFWLRKSKVGGAEHPNVAAAGKFAGADFFKIFNYPLLHGDSSKVLHATRGAVISESLAKKLYHTTDAVGKRLIWSNAELEMEFEAQITGVFKDLPKETSEPFEFLISNDILLNAGNSTYKKWNNYGPTTYLVLNKDADPAKFESKLKNFLKDKDLENYTLFLRKYSEAYLYNQTSNGKITGGRVDYVKLFAFAAIMILLIAVINFTNLATANASKRLKEIGIKKVLGVHRSKLIVQYLLEAVVLSFISLLISLLATELILPVFNAVTGKQLSVHLDLLLISLLLGMGLITGILAGLYPAIYLSGLKPVSALKGKLQFSASATWLRQGLVVFQFVCSGVLIVGVFVVLRQVKYVQTKNQGFQKENVLYFETEGKLKDNLPFVVGEIKKLDGVVAASGINRELLGDLSYTTGNFDWEGRDQNEVIRFQRADITAGFIETLGMKIVAGRAFSEKFSSDTMNVVINEAGIKVMRLKNPIGKTFTLWGNKMQIIGVVADFHFESLHKAVGPMFMRNKPKGTNRVMIRITPGKERIVIDALKQFNAAYNPGYSLDYKFLDQDFQQQYLAETRMSELSKYFAIMAIVISCLGLFGLATFAAEKRFKEIGIRKVLGARVSELMYMLSRDFMKPVLVSLIISIPIAYALCNNWLSSYAYRIELEWWFFAAGGLLAVIISLATVFYQTYKSATMNPIASIKAD